MKQISLQGWKKEEDESVTLGYSYNTDKPALFFLVSQFALLRGTGMLG
jgi:hypothetical protein